MSTENTHDDSSFLIEELNKLESFIPYRDSINQNVSEVDVAWHLDHSLKVINAVIDTLKSSNPEDYRQSVNIGRSYILLSGRIPRGRGQSPDFVLPPKNVLTQDLEKQLKHARAELTTMNSLHKNSYFNHFAFGMLHKEDAKRFLEIHTNHHLAIVEDILTTSEDN